jgi:histidinol dehydrogenase
MQIIIDPKRETWKELLKRPAFDTRELAPRVTAIMDDVRVNGDAAVSAYTTKFDGIEIDSLRVSREEIESAIDLVPQNLKDAIATAKNNIEKFHAVVFETPEKIETTQGVFCWKKRVPIEKVGLYIPAGSAPLFSTVLMLAVPAQLAGCLEVILCSPASSNGTVNAATLYAADLCGVTSIFKIGGAQAIAAMAYGTESVPQVYKIFGPGNQFVTEAKLQAMRYGVAIDMPAGPSEVAIIADESCVPTFVAADLLSQAEHGPDSQVVLVSDSQDVVERTLAEIEKQVIDLPRRDIAKQALANSKFIVLGTITDAIDLINQYAPEHLILATKEAEADAEKVRNAGSIFIGNYSCESAGDYASGTNHTLPTNGAARAFSGVSVDSFTRTMTLQRLTSNGIANLGPVIETMAVAEGLDAHARAVSIRRAYTKDLEVNRGF